MPIISIFFGIIVRLHYHDHNPPHIHAEYQGFSAFFAISSGELLGGRLPATAQTIIQRWIRKHQRELRANWHRARRHEPLLRIPGADV